MRFHYIGAGILAFASAACQTTGGNISGDQICRDLRIDYQRQCNFAEEFDRRDCVIALKTAAMKRVDLAYPEDPDNPAAASERGYLISSINYCPVRTPIGPDTGTGVSGYWNAIGPDIFGQEYRCEGGGDELEFTSLGSVLNESCNVGDLKRMTNWRLDGDRLVLFNDVDEIIVFRRTGGGWRSLDGQIAIYR